MSEKLYVLYGAKDQLIIVGTRKEIIKFMGWKKSTFDWYLYRVKEKKNCMHIYKI